MASGLGSSGSPRGRVRPRSEVTDSLGHPDFKRTKLSSGRTSNKDINRDDTDFAPDDWDGRIKRCEERIEAAVHNKETFRRKLERLKKARDTQPAVMNQFPGKSWDVIKRMASLRLIKDHLEEFGDPYKELINVEAILNAYNDGELEWNDNATYWCQGKMIAGGEPFSFKTFAKLNTSKNRGDGGFWVEGIYPLEPKQLVNKCKVRANNAGEFQMDLLVRLDSFTAETDANGDQYPEYNLRFLDDSGSSMMCIYHDDMIELMGGDAQASLAPLNHLMGYQDFNQANGGTFICKVIAVEVNMIGEDDDYNSVEMTDWTTVSCAVFETESTTPDGPPSRLSGPWLRKMLFAATAPERNPTLYIGERKTDIISRDMIPAIMPEYMTPPVFLRPPLAIEWKQDQQSGFWYPIPDFEHQGIAPKHVRSVTTAVSLPGLPAGTGIGLGPGPAYP